MTQRTSSNTESIKFIPHSTPRFGFTIVELVIIIVVIALLATITIISYSAVTNQSREVSIKNDLQTNAMSLDLDYVHDQKYPISAESIKNGSGLSVSKGNTLTYYVSSERKAFCLQGQGYGKSFYVSNVVTVAEPGTCSGHIGVAAGGEAPAQSGGVTVLAGSETAGFLEGTGTAARFNTPGGMANDAAGNLYVADYYSHRIRKVTPSGVVTTFAGTGAQGYADGAGAGATFNYPSDVDIDSAGNLYVADRSSHRIRMITPGGVVSTIAGNSNAGTMNGTGTAARFNYPQGLTVDTGGNIFVADTMNHRIRKITSAGVVTTFAGSFAGADDGTGTAAEFNYPYGIAVDSSGTIYVADTNNHRIRKITSAGVVTTFAGSTAGESDGTGTAAQFRLPRDIVLDTSGNLYVTDHGNHRIRKITPAGVVTTVAGSSQGASDGVGTNAQFNSPWGISKDASGNMFISESHRVRKLTI